MAVVLYEKRDRIAYITLNRPEVLNAINIDMFNEMRMIWQDFKEDPNSWVAIVTGAGDRGFCTGADSQGGILQENEERWKADPLHDPEYKDDMDILPIPDLTGLWKPTIAAVNGYAVAWGCSLALWCDIRVASENARFGMPAVAYGIAPHTAPVLFPRLMPYAWAMELLLTGDSIDAQQAYRLGFVSRVVPAAQLMPAAEEIAKRICQHSPLVVRAIKEQLVRAQSMSSIEGIRLAGTIRSVLYMTEDVKTGMRAFREKRYKKE